MPSKVRILHSAPHRLFLRKNMQNINLSKDELILLNNALNEILHGDKIPESEFKTRTGADLYEAEKLLAKISNFLDETKN
jgi:hypothetical protein